MRYLSILTFLFSIALINPAHAGVLIYLDLSVTNRLTLTATTETAIATTDPGGTTGTGIVLEGTGIVPSDLTGGASDTFGVYSTGAFSQVKTSRLLNNGVNSLNLYDSSDDRATSITSGQQAFVGTTTINLDDATIYNNLLNGPSSGKIYAFADNSLTFATDGTYIGDWAKVPEPSTAIAMGVLGVLGFAGNRRRRRQS